MLAVGAKAPDFALPDETGTVRMLVDLLASLPDGGSLLLYFYPGDFTPICTREACAFQAALPEARTDGVRVVGVSAQDPATHARFKAAYGLEFTLLADEQREAIRAYDATGLFGLGTGRVSYLIGKDGVIQDAVAARFGVAPHVGLARKR
jgi:peroxiredoxin Q/BCP